MERGAANTNASDGRRPDSATAVAVTGAAAMLHGSKAIPDFPADCNELPDEERFWLENPSVRLIVPITGLATA